MNVCRSFIGSNRASNGRLKVLQYHLQNVSHARPTSMLNFRPGGYSNTTFMNMRASSTGTVLDLLVNHLPQEEVEVTYPLTVKEAFSFIEDVLKLPNPQSLLREDRHAFLNLLAKQMNYAVPFSNIVLVGKPFGQRVAPSLEECKEEVVACRGGSCFIINTFNKILLDLLGYKTRFTTGKNPYHKVMGTHTGLVVQDLRYSGSEDLLEVGTRRPLFEAIPLDFGEESPEYAFGHVVSKFFRSEDGLVHWCKELDRNTKAQEAVIERGNKRWEVQLIYDLDLTVPLSLMVACHGLIWPNADIVPEVHGDAVVSGYSGKQFVVIKGKQVSVVREDFSKENYTAESKEHLINIYQKYFPQFSVAMVERAIENTISKW